MTSRYRADLSIGAQLVVYVDSTESYVKEDVYGAVLAMDDATLAAAVRTAIKRKDYDIEEINDLSEQAREQSYLAGCDAANDEADAR